MAQESNGLFLAIVIGVFIIMILSIGYMLFSLAKQGDERKALIKAKAMSGTFIAVIGILIIQIIVSFSANHQLEGLNPLIFLSVISIVFFVLLVFNKKRYGG
jgi:cell division protein FtsW (lipid II flippase)